MNNELEQQLQTLSRLYKRSDKVYSGIASRLGLSDTAFSVLYAVLHTDAPITQHDLSTDWFYPIQTVNSAVSSLQKRGLVRLEMIPGTKNRKSIILTDAGREFASRTICLTDDMERRAFLRFSEAERAAYLSLFQRHLEYLEAEKARMLESLSD